MYNEMCFEAQSVDKSVENAPETSLRLFFFVMFVLYLTYGRWASTC